MQRKVITLPTITEEKENVDSVNQPIKFEDNTKAGRNSASPQAFNKLVKTMFNNPAHMKSIMYNYDDFVLVKPLARRVK